MIPSLYEKEVFHSSECILCNSKSSLQRGVFCNQMSCKWLFHNQQIVYCRYVAAPQSGVCKQMLRVDRQYYCCAYGQQGMSYTQAQTACHLDSPASSWTVLCRKADQSAAGRASWFMPDDHGYNVGAGAAPLQQAASQEQFLDPSTVFAAGKTNKRPMQRAFLESLMQAAL